MEPRYISEFAETLVEVTGTVVGAIAVLDAVLVDDTELHTDSEQSLNLAVRGQDHSVN